MKVENVDYASWLKTLAKGLSHPFARDSEKMVGFLRELERTLSKEKKWQRTDLEGFQRQIDNAQIHGPEEINRVYWKDVSNNYNAWAILSLWRGIEILDSGLSSLDKAQYVSAAVLARSRLKRATKLLRSSSSRNISVRSMPRAMTCCSNPGISMRGCLGMG
jgi:hypothetical protein